MTTRPSTSMRASESQPLRETRAQMSHPDPNGPADRTPIEIGEVWDNPVTGELVLGV